MTGVFAVSLLDEGDAESSTSSLGLCWLPVVWIQTRMRDLAAAAARDGTALPPRYFSYYKAWFGLGWPAFTGVIAIFVLMLWKPQW